MKPLSDITLQDLRRHPVWEFANDEETSTTNETILLPHDELAVDAIFPIAYDIWNMAIGDPNSVRREGYLLPHGKNCHGLRSSKRRYVLYDDRLTEERT